MRVATFQVDRQRQVGQLAPDGATVRLFEFAAAAGALPLMEVMAAGEKPITTGTTLRLDQVTLEAPIPRPRRNIFCVGKNYHEHAHEFAHSGFDSSAAAGAVPDAPIIFSKVPETVVGPGDAIRIDSQVSPAVDYEAELAVVIGKGGRGIRRDA